MLNFIFGFGSTFVYTYLGGKMRKYIILLLGTLTVALNGMPVAETIINTYNHIASASVTRCITATHYSWEHVTDYLNVRLWDITDPVYPRQGVNLPGSHYSRYSQPAVYGNYLLYLMHNNLHIMDIENIDIPVELTQIPALGTCRFVIYDHYAVLGKQNGSLAVYDISDPPHPVFVNSTSSTPNIVDMWVSGNKLGVRYVNPGYDTSKLFSFTEETMSLVELASVNSDYSISYVGALNERLVCQTDNGTLRIYDYSQGNPPVLVYETSAPYNMSQVLAHGDILISMSQSNCVRFFRLNPNDTLTEFSHFDLSHMSFGEGHLCGILGDRLTFTVDTNICMILDISNLDPAPEYVGGYNNGTYINTIANPQGTDRLYFMNENRLSCVKLDYSGALTDGPDIYNTGYGHRMLAYNQCLYLIATIDNSLHFTILNVQDPENPILVNDTQVPYANIFSIKGDRFYLGSFTSVGKHMLSGNEAPVWLEDLSYNDPDIGEDIEFLDFDSYGDIDYGIGVWGNFIDGYYPLLACWLPNGQVTRLFPPYLLYSLNVVGEYMYLTGRGINILDVSCGHPRLDRIVEVNNHTRGVTSSLLYGDRYLIECYQVSNQIRVYDLIAYRYPELIQTINQGHTSEAFAVVGNRLLAANGNYGIDVYNLNIVAENDDCNIPPIRELSVYPNPFKEQMNISFSLEKPTMVKVECFNIKGQRVYSQDLDRVEAGENKVVWNGNDEQGNSCASGVYIITIQSPEGRVSKKITKIN
jgi:hypothetical protein